MFAIKHRHRLAGKKHNPVAVSDGNPLAIRLAADHERRSKRRDQHRRNGALHAKGNKVHCNNRTGRTGNNADDITDDIILGLVYDRNTAIYDDLETALSDKFELERDGNNIHIKEVQ